jgi:hypothetical protein
MLPNAGVDKPLVSDLRGEEIDGMQFVYTIDGHQGFVGPVEVIWIFQVLIDHGVQLPSFLSEKIKVFEEDDDLFVLLEQGVQIH